MRRLSLKTFGGLIVGGLRRLPNCFLQKLELGAPIGDRGKLTLEALAHLGQRIDGRPVFPGGGAKREEPLLGLLQFLGIEDEGAVGLIDGALGLGHFGKNPIKRLANMIEPPAGRLAPPLKLAQRRVKAGNRGTIAGQRLLGLAQSLGILFRRHHDLPGFGEFRFLARDRIERPQFFRRVFEIIAFGFGPLHQRAVFIKLGPGRG